MAFACDEIKYRKSLLSPTGVGGGAGGNLYISRTFEGDRGLIETGGLFEGSLLNFAKTMVSVLRKELEYKANKFKYKNLEVISRDQKQIRIHQPRSVHTEFYSRHWLKQSL